MSFQGISDKEVDQYLKQKIGDFRPDWQSLYFDLVGMGEMGGLAEITKPEAVRQLSRGFKQFIEDTAERGFTDITGAGKLFRRIVKGVRRAPQEILDPLESMRFESIEGTSNARVNIPNKQLAVDPMAPAERSYQILGHELIHADDLKDVWNKGRISVNYQEMMEMEDRAYQNMDAVGALLKQGKTTYFDYLDTVHGSFKDLLDRLTEQYLDLGNKTTAKDLYDRVMNTKNLSQDAFALGREVHAGKVDLETLREAHKMLKSTEGMDAMERATRGQYFGEAEEFANILGGKTEGLEGKIKILKDWGALKPEDFPF